MIWYALLYLLLGYITMAVMFKEAGPPEHVWDIILVQIFAPLFLLFLLVERAAYYMKRNRGIKKR